MVPIGDATKVELLTASWTDDLSMHAGVGKVFVRNILSTKPSG